jgi:hypothetical protein
MAPRSVSLADFSSCLSPYWSVESVTGRDGIVISDGKTRVYLIHADGFGDTLQNDLQGVYCDPKFRRFYISTLPDRTVTFFTMDYSDVQLVKKVLAVAVDSEQMVVDDGFSGVMSGKDLANKIKSNRDWDWRDDFLHRRGR